MSGCPRLPGNHNRHILTICSENRYTYERSTIEIDKMGEYKKNPPDILERFILEKSFFLFSKIFYHQHPGIFLWSAM